MKNVAQDPTSPHDQVVRVSKKNNKNSLKLIWWLKSKLAILYSTDTALRETIFDGFFLADIDAVWFFFINLLHTTTTKKKHQIQQSIKNLKLKKYRKKNYFFSNAMMRWCVVGKDKMIEQDTFLVFFSIFDD